MNAAQHAAARRVVDNWQNADLAAAVQALDTLTQDMEFATDAQLGRACDLYAGDDVQIDEGAPVSIADDGVWVQAWVWLPNPEQEAKP